MINESIDLKKYNLNNLSAIEKAKDYHNINDFNLAIRILLEKYPKFKKYTEQYINGTNSYLYNCFVMKKNIFNNFCAWLFDILFELEKRIDISKYSIQKSRTCGTIGERLLGIYILYLKDNFVKVKELPLIFIRDTVKKEEIQPAFENKNSNYA